VLTEDDGHHPSLSWMYREALKAGLLLHDSKKVTHANKKPSSRKAELTDSMTFFYKILEMLPLEYLDDEGTHILR